jgi:glucose-6-phosphate-specific signal transduction histidine kinase
MSARGLARARPEARGTGEPEPEAEALTNVVKHAGATRADGSVAVEDGKLRIVGDDGGAGRERTEAAWSACVTGWRRSTAGS